MIYTMSDNHWEEIYSNSEPEDLPWYSPTLDNDIQKWILAHQIPAGRLLDIGTGPATQAIELAMRGFEVTATDISKTAIAKAQQRGKKAHVTITFKVDDILSSKLVPNAFDYVIDRGVFHTLHPSDRSLYEKTVRKLLKPNGWLVLKAFSSKTPGTSGPYRFTKKQLTEYFESDFEIVELYESVFYGTLVPAPYAWFGVFRRKKNPKEISR